MKYIIKHITFALCLLTVYSCSNDEKYISVNNKEKIMLTADINHSYNLGLSRSSSNNDLPFTSGTKISLNASAYWNERVIKEKDATVQSPTSNNTYNSLTAELYWDDFGAGDPTNSKVEDTPSDSGDEGLTIYGAAINGNSTAVSVDDWKALSCSVDNDQSDGWSNKDLLISNNISKANAHKYDKSNNNISLEFNHAYSKVTINFIKGNGFSTSSDDFQASSVTLKGFNTNGTLDITTGLFTALSNSWDITPHKESTNSSGANITYTALVLPGRDFSYTDDALAFTIDGNNYSVQTDKITSAINGTDKKMKSGINYVLNITVNKTAIVVDAHIKDWEDVTASDEPSNGQEATFNTVGSGLKQNFNMFMSTVESDNNKNWGTGYGDPTKIVYDSDNNKFGYENGKQIYWPNNNTYYHFRALAPESLTISKDGNYDDYTALTTLQGNYIDVLWGAPYKNENELYPAIGPTKNAINLQFFHKMAQVFFIINTTTNDDKVDLNEYPTINMNCTSTGKLRIGSGEINYSDDQKFMFTLTGTIANNEAKTTVIGVVPQYTYTVSLEITTSDKNIYKISSMSIIKDNSNNYISKWEPGKIYTYTLTLKKSGISMNVSVKDWINVSGANENVTIQ